MTTEVATSIVGIFLFLFLKRVIYSADKGKALFASLLEVPVDISLLGFLMGVAALSSGQMVGNHTPLSIMALTFLMAFSVFIWKYTCSRMTERAGEVHFHTPLWIALLTLLNIVVCLSSIGVAVNYLGG